MVGEFKDDQLQTHQHLYEKFVFAGGGTGIQGADYYSVRTASTASESNTGRKGAVTRGKRKGVKYIIKVL